MAETRYEKWIIPLLSEFIGQLMFVFLHCMSNHTIAVTPGVLGSPVLPAVTNGLLIAIVVMALGHVSGAHVNPVVTMAFTLSGELRPIMAPFYICTQLLGSMSGAGLALAINGQPSGAFGLGPGVSIWQGLLCEIVLTVVLLLSIIMCAIDQGLPTAPFAVGFSVIACIFAGFSISGGCMNPALSFGPAVASGQWDNYWIYWVGPPIGGLIALFCHRFILGNRERRLCGKGRGDDDTRETEKRELPSVTYHVNGGERNGGFQIETQNSRM